MNCHVLLHVKARDINFVVMGPLTTEMKFL
jgi:hypothetical protein